jgi:hypothetical protein
MAHRLGHGAQLDPLPAFLESLEKLELIHLAPARTPAFPANPPKEKARPMGRASFF